MCMLVVMNNYSFKKYIKLCLVFCACTILGLLAKSSQKDILNLSINENFYPKETRKWRTIASPDDSQNNCMNAVKEISGDQRMNLTEYNRYKQEFFEGADRPQKFQSAEHYIAYLESKNTNEHISFTRYYMSLPKYSKKFHQFMMTEVSSRKRLQFIFDGYLKYIVKSSIRDDNLPEVESAKLLEILRQKLIQDAINEFLDEKSTLHKVLDHKFMSFVKNFAGLVPMLFGKPPLYVPYFIRKPILKRLLKSRNINTLIDDYNNLSEKDIKRFMRYTYYDQFFYAVEMGVAGYFIYIIYEDTRNSIQNGEEAVEHSEQVKKDMEEMNAIISNREGCGELSSCMQTYKDLWEGDEEIKEIVIKTCQEHYIFSDSCLEEWE